LAFFVFIGSSVAFSYILSQCDRLSKLGIKCAFIWDDDGSRTMDIIGHARAAKFFGENSKGGEFFPFVNGEDRKQSEKRQ